VQRDGDDMDADDFFISSKRVDLATVRRGLVSSSPSARSTSSSPEPALPARKKRRKDETSTSSSKTSSATTVPDETAFAPVAKHILGINDPALRDSPLSLAAMAKAARHARGDVSPEAVKVKLAPPKRSALSNLQNQIIPPEADDEDDDLADEEEGYLPTAVAIKQKRQLAMGALAVLITDASLMSGADTLMSKRQKVEAPPARDKGKARADVAEERGICPVCDKSVRTGPTAGVLC
jgi:hypothetical protein